MGKLGWGTVLSGILVAAACGSSEDAASPSSSGGAAGDAGGTPNPCSICIETKCSAEIAGCASEPDCTGYLDCFRACPALPSGAVDETCEDACPDPSSTTGKTALGALIACRKEGAGLDCSECGAKVPIDECGVTALTDACPKCEEEKCCVTRAACDANPTCLALIGCIKGCTPGDDACSNQCYVDNEAGVAALGTHLICVFSECPEASTCGPVPEVVQCIAKKCKNTQGACASDLECWLLQSCVGDCAGSVPCIEQCAAAHPSAQQLFVEASACALALCDSAI